MEAEKDELKKSLDAISYLCRHRRNWHAIGNEFPKDYMFAINQVYDLLPQEYKS